MAKVKAEAEAFKIYQFRHKSRGMFLEALRESFRTSPTDFQSRWRCRDKTPDERKSRERDVLRFGQRMLEVAAFQASTVNRDVGHDIEGWAEVARAAAKASAELRRFLSSAVKPAPQKQWEKQEHSAAEAAPRAVLEGISARVLEISWLQMLVAIRGVGADLDATRQEATSKVQALLNAVTELDDFSEFTRASYRQWKDARKKGGSPQKRKFAVEMMRGWVFLFGRWPQEGNERFAHFLSVAWGDICQNAANDERWGYVIKQARKELKPELVRLAQNGPNWL